MEIEDPGSDANSEKTESGCFYRGKKVSIAGMVIAIGLCVAAVATVSFLSGTGVGRAALAQSGPVLISGYKAIHEAWEKKSTEVHTASLGLCIDTFLKQSHGDEKKAMGEFKGMCEAMESDPSQEPMDDLPQEQRKAVCTEHCGKLWEKLTAKASIVGTFPRCAARLSKETFSSDALKCKLTPFSSTVFADFWVMLQGEGVILALGQGLNPDGSAPQVLVQRAQAAALLHKETGYPIIVSGGDDRAVGQTEAFGMAYELFKNGVPMEAILYEPQAVNTFENAWFALRQVRRYMPKVKKIHLVTSDWHMPRGSLFLRFALEYFANADGKDYVPAHFQGMDHKSVVEEHPVQTPCPKQTSQDGGFMGSNLATLDKKIADEINIIKTMINGPTKWSMGDDNYETWIWGVKLDVDKQLQREALDQVLAVNVKFKKRCQKKHG